MQMKPEKVYACYNKDKNVRLSSSSGAVFSSLAECVLNKQGVVYGVAMSWDCYSAEFISVTDREGLTRLRGSKYLQAKVGSTFKKVKADLQFGKMVLFTGTGCQINGLKNFLGRDYDNLICVDVICHGTPSPKLWKKYAQYQENNTGGKLKWINFRCKDENRTDLDIKGIWKDIPMNSVKKMYVSKDRDPYMQMFLRDYCLRPSCYECPYATTERKTDMTIGDFWHIEETVPDFYDPDGNSLFLIHTNRGEELFEKIQGDLDYRLSNTTQCWQANLEAPTKKSEQREEFWNDYQRKGIDFVMKKYGTVPMKTKIKNKLLRIIGGGYTESSTRYAYYSERRAA